jgi:hypothetical protein
MNYSSRFFLYAPFALLLLVGVGAGVNWYLAMGPLSRSLIAMEGGAEAVPGVKIGFRTMAIGGFPFRIDAVFDDFRVEVATKDGPIVWRAEHFALHRLAYGRDDTIFEAAGRQALSLGGGRPLVFQTGSLHASAVRDTGGLARFDLDLVAFGSRAFTASRLQLHMRRSDNGLDLFASADDLRTPEGDQIKAAMVQAGASAPRAFDGLRAGRVTWQSALEAWRQANGSLHADAVHVVSEPLDAMGQGSIRLDDAHRLSGLIDFKIAGMAQWLRAPRRGALAGALRARATDTGGNEAGKMGVVLGAQGGIAYLGDQPIGTAGPLY